MFYAKLKNDVLVQYQSSSIDNIKAAMKAVNFKIYDVFDDDGNLVLSVNDIKHPVKTILFRCHVDDIATIRAFNPVPDSESTGVRSPSKWSFPMHKFSMSLPYNEVQSMRDHIAAVNWMRHDPGAVTRRYNFPRRLLTAQVHDDDRQKVLDYARELNEARAGRG